MQTLSSFSLLISFCLSFLSLLLYFTSFKTELLCGVQTYWVLQFGNNRILDVTAPWPEPFRHTISTLILPKEERKLAAPISLSKLQFILRSETTFLEPLDFAQSSFILDCGPIMSSDRTHSPTSTSPPSGRRLSLNPASLGDFFSKPNNSNMNSSTGNSSFPNPITTAAAANAQSGRRRMSITTLGLSGSPTQPSPFGAYAGRRDSLSSSESCEDAIEDVEHSPANNSASPIARRVSFGAQALRDVRGGSGSGNGEGFNWSAALRTRAERAPSVGGSYPASSHLQASLMGLNDPHAHQRSASIAIMEQPTREIPREPRQNKPDFFQEKILRADFMD
ncbi:hypothetical protein TMatcc_005903 [Talaromyces marneffei ATCC 18224]